MGRLALAAAALALLLAGATAAEGRTAVRALPGGPRATAPARASEARPPRYAPREFPSVLRAPELPPGPDGILWRRLRARHPEVSTREWLARPAARDASSRARASQVDTVRILALRVDFLKDSAGGGSTTADGRFDLTPADTAVSGIDLPPHNRDYFDRHFEALRRYYEKQSGGQLALTWDIYPAETDSAYHLSDTADYGPWVLEHGDADLLALAEKLVRDAFATADTSSAPPDFRRYDSFLLFHAGTDFQGDVKQDTPYDIPSFNLFLAEPVAVQDSTFFLDLVMVVPETSSQDGFTSALNGVMAHEFGHQLGFFDLYDVLTFIPMVGMFSLMDSGDQVAALLGSAAGEDLYVRGLLPASLDPWQKMVFFPGGVDPFWVGTDSTFTLPPVQLNNRMALVPLSGQGVAEDPGQAPLLASEYFIVENRSFDLHFPRPPREDTLYVQSDSTTGVILGPANLPLEVTERLGLPPDTLGAYEQDHLLPGGGILIWHIDLAALEAAMSYCYGCVNIFPERRGVCVEEADGIQDLGDIYSVEWTGGPLDYWFQGGRWRFGPDTDPDTRSTAGGWTGVQIAVLDSARAEMGVEVRRGGVHEGWPRYVGRPLGPDWPSVSIRPLGPESLCPADLDGDGTPEIVGVNGPHLSVFEPDGSGYRHAQADGFFAGADSAWLPGVCVANGFVDESGEPAGLIAVATPSTVAAWSPQRELRLLYPGGPGGATPRFTVPPMGLDSVLVIGDEEGRVRGLLPGAMNPLVWRTSPGGHAVRSLAAGDLRGTGHPVIAWGDGSGQVRIAEGTQRAGFLPVGAPLRLGVADPAPIRWLIIQEGREGGEGTLLALDEGGRIALFGGDGERLPGWPRSIGAVPAGPPAIGDPDGDGMLEYAVTGADGRVHLFARTGNDEALWPRSVWAPDAVPYGWVGTGPLMADLTGDGVAELLQGSADGTVHAFDGEGQEIPGWPLAATGFPVVAGPLPVPNADAGSLELLVGDARGFAALLLPGAEAHDPRAGEMWRPDGGPERRHVYGRALVPVPEGMAELIDPGRVIFTPNPAVGARAALRARMGRPGTIHLRLYDTRGQRVWEDSYAPPDVAEEVVWPLDLRSVAPGLYVARIVAEGDGQEVRLLRKLAVVR